MGHFERFFAYLPIKQRVLLGQRKNLKNSKLPHFSFWKASVKPTSFLLFRNVNRKKIGLWNLNNKEQKMNNQQLNINNLIQDEVNRISTKYNKDFLDCEDIMKITGLGRDNVRSLLRSKDFPTTKVGKRQVVSVLNFVRYITLQNQSEVANG